LQVDYPEELTKIEDFLTRFVATPTRRNGHGNLPANDDDEAEEEEDLADEVDGMDMDDNDDENPGKSKAKYMKVLRRVANRRSASVTIDLNDIKEVS
jgi:DNA replication licensing factor MCM7